VELLTRLRATQPDLVGLILTAHGTVDDAVRAMRAGALEFLTKPLDLRRIELVLEGAAERAALARNQRAVSAATGFSVGIPGLVGVSAALEEVARLARRAAPVRAPVLVLGESGTGKEVLARGIHALSPRREGPFCVVNCAALPDTLIEAELFGHEKGAFTGADRQKPGRFELAAGGTLFLDEIGDIPLAMQVKLLGVLQSGSYERLGGQKTLKADVRIVAATHRDLAACIAQGTFREDLFYRINVVTLVLPPLRERREDIRHLARSFLRATGEESEPPRSLRLTPEAEAWLGTQELRGNVRELRNLIERAAVFSAEDELDVAAFEVGQAPSVAQAAPASGGSLDDAYIGLEAEVAELEARRLSQALSMAAGNQSAAARLLKMSERAIRYKLRKQGR
jgi:two-component system NtrC family response regulator